MSNEERVAKIGGKRISGVNYIDTHDYIPKSLSILKKVGNLRLVGETGTGKTTLVHKLAETLSVPLFEIVLTRDVTKWDLLASDVLKEGETKTREGIILKWLRSEGILYLDGFNYAEPSILSLIESLADFRGSVWIPELETVFKRSEKHFLVISYNPSEKSGYSGTFLENIATIRRFEGLVIDYIDRQEEIGLIKAASGGNYDFAVKFVEIARKTRDLYRRGKLRTPITTGNLLNYAKLLSDLSEEDLVEIASSLFPEDERNTFKRLFEKSGEIDVDSLKTEDKEEQ
jgi:MoxR-like ATPase